MFPPRRPALALTIAVLTLTAACSAGANSTHDPATTPAATPRAAAAAPQVTSPATGDPATSNREPTCYVLAANLVFLQRVTTTGAGPTLAAAVARMRDLERSAPADIRPDIKIIADFDQQILNTVSAGGSPDGIHETPALTAALTHEAVWIRNNCH